MSDVEDTHFWYKGMRFISRLILANYLLNKNNNILDAGCGTGGNFNFLSQFGKVVGIDISEYAINLAKQKGILNIKKGSIDNIPYPDNSFDLITGFDVIGHKQVNEKKAIDEFYRVLKPGGLLMIRVAAYEWLYSNHDLKVQNSRRYTKKSLINVLKRKNFQVIKKTYANTFLFPFIVLKRLMSNLFNLKKTESDVKTYNSLISQLLFIPFFIEGIIINLVSLPFGTSIIVVAKK